jgi:hypothetical protein
MCLSEKDYSRKYRNKQEENFAVSGLFQDFLDNSAGL